METFLEKYGITDTSQLYSYKIKNVGKDANNIKNPVIKKDDIYIMYCEYDTEVMLDDKSIEKITEFENQTGNNVVFYKLKNGYVATHLHNRTNLYIHQIITGCYGNGKGTNTVSVDHIDRNPLNNCYVNLRIADRKTQKENSKGILEGTKRARNKYSKDLPDGITQDMMLKYVVYYNECYHKEKQLFREYFRIEGHPKLVKCWSTSKSNKISIHDKLNQANQFVKELNKCVVEEDMNVLFNKVDHDKKKIKMSNLKLHTDTGANADADTDINININIDMFDKLPKYYNYRIIRNKLHILYEKVNNGKKTTLRRVIKNKNNIDKEVNEFIEYVNNKLSISSRIHTETNETNSLMDIPSGVKEE
jgi:hypothetical protein